jgi:hypothetical protein
MTKRLNNFSGIASVLLLLLVVVNSLLLSNIRSNLRVVQPPEWVGALVAVFIIVMVLVTLFNLVSLFRQFKHFKDENLLRSATFVLGFFALFLLIVDVVMLQDIGQELKAGYDSSGEWNIVFFSHLLLGIFALLMITQFSMVRKQLRQEQEMQHIEKDEAVFLTVHQVGIFAALLGFFCLVALKIVGVPHSYLDGLFILSSVVALFPFGLGVLYWLYIKRKEKLTEWYDEKQFLDLSRAALITLVLSVLLMTGIFLLMMFHVIDESLKLWFPIYLCSTLLIFSVSNLVVAHE